jgi:hypothetical protein
MGSRTTIAALLLLAAAAAAFAGDAADSYRRLYGDREREALSSATLDDDAALAADVLAGAEQVPGDAALQVLLYEKACELGRRGPAGYRTAMAALEALGAAVPNRRKACEALRIEVLEDLYRKSDGEDRVSAGEELVHERILLARRRIDEGDLATAKKLLWDAQVVAGREDSARREEAEVLRKAVEQRIRLIARAEELQAKLADAPTDSETRRELVRTCLVDLNDPQRASAHLGPGVPDRWVKLVPLAAQEPAKLSEPSLLELGEWYLGLAGETKGVPRHLMLSRSLGFHRAFESRHAGEDEARLRARLRIAEAEKAIFEVDRGLVARAGSNHWVDLIGLTDPARDAVGRWLKDERGLHTSGSKTTNVYFPLKITGGYELEAFFVRESGGGYPSFVTPCGDFGGIVVIGGWGGDKSGLNRIKGRDGDRNETTHIQPIVNGRAYRVRIRIDPDGPNATVKVWLDGTEIISWRGRQDWFKDKYRRSDRWLGIVANRDRIHFLSLKVRMMSGEPELVSGE